MNKPRCKHYTPDDINWHENCGNCRKWVGLKCCEHEILVEDAREASRLGAFNKMMLDNKGVVLP